MFSISIKSDIPTLGIFASDVQRNQMPFAVKETLNSLAFAVRKNTVDRVFPAAFKVRNKRFATASYRVEKATKTRLVAKVFDKLERGNLEDHAAGGTKTPTGRHVAIPSRTLATRRSGKGVPKNMRPRTALGRPEVFKTTVNGQPVIAHRKGKKGKFEVLYVLEQRAKINRTFPFYRQAQVVVNREVDGIFKKKFEFAMRTAKPRRTAR